MTDADMKQREKIVKSMKKNFKDFRGRYGKRAKEVMYATATKMAMKEMIEPEDKGEYDYEGDMAKSSLKTIIRNAQVMHDMLSAETNLPEWVQGKITLAEDYIVSAAQYMQSEMKEEVDISELKTSTITSAVQKRAGRMADVELDKTLSPQNKKILMGYHKKKLQRNARHELVHNKPALKKMVYKKQGGN